MATEIVLTLNMDANNPEDGFEDALASRGVAQVVHDQVVQAVRTGEEFVFPCKLKKNLFQCA